MLNRSTKNANFLRGVIQKWTELLLSQNALQFTRTSLIARPHLAESAGHEPILLTKDVHRSCVHELQLAHWIEGAAFADLLSTHPVEGACFAECLLTPRLNGALPLLNALLMPPRLEGDSFAEYMLTPQLEEDSFADRLLERSRLRRDSPEAS